MAKILITGGTGLVGARLSRILTAGGHEVIHLSRYVRPGSEFKTYQWDIGSHFIDEAAFERLDHIVHLAGAGIAEERWTEKRKQVIVDSRVKSLELLHHYIVKGQIPLKSFISASAIGYYGMDTGDLELSEDAPAGDDFLAYVVKLWEAAADQFQEHTRVAKVRIGVVLSADGGAMTQIAMPVRYYLGAPLGAGDQYMSWIHIDDLCRIFEHVLEKELEGTYNATAPNPVTNEALTRSLARHLKKPLFLPNVPAFVLKLMLGEMAGIVLGGNRVSSSRIREKGFRFKFAELEEAVKDLLG